MTTVLSLSDASSEVPPPAAPSVWTFPIPVERWADYPLLRGVDPYGDTCFNRVQAPLLREELERLEQSMPTSEDLSLVRALGVLVAQLEARPHHYLWFVGD